MVDLNLLKCGPPTEGPGKKDIQKWKVAGKAGSGQNRNIEYNALGVEASLSLMRGPPGSGPLHQQEWDEESFN